MVKGRVLVQWSGKRKKVSDKDEGFEVEEDGFGQNGR